MQFSYSNPFKIGQKLYEIYELMVHERTDFFESKIQEASTGYVKQLLFYSVKITLHFQHK